MKIVAYFELHELRWHLPEEVRRHLEVRFPEVEIVAVDERAALPAALADADAFLGWTFPAEHFAAAPRLRWVQSINAGADANLFPALRDSDVVLCGGAGLHTTCIPEHVVGQMLVLARNFHEALRMQARSEWNRFGVILHGGGIRELRGSKLALIGAGPVGTHLVPLARALGQSVRVLRRDPSRDVPGAEAVVGPDALHPLLAWADFVVLALPLTAETHRMIDAAALAAMKPSAYLINVARGEVVAEAALIAALRDGTIQGAALDVFDPEPLPPEHPFWSMPNVVLTPHVSGYTPRYFELAMELFEENLERFLEGRPLRNIVDKRLGYTRPNAAGSMPSRRIDSMPQRSASSSKVRE